MVAVAAAIAPATSFVLQYLFSAKNGTRELFWHHATIAYLDWIFVPFNYLVIDAINWRRGATLTWLWCASVMLNIVAHAQWQISGADPGHMITARAVVLPAGWVHLAFATLETVLLLAFVFCRINGAPHVVPLSVLMAAYFVGVPICSYFIHGRLAPTDLSVAVVGLTAAVGYPLVERSRAHAAAPSP